MGAACSIWNSIRAALRSTRSTEARAERREPPAASSRVSQRPQSGRATCAGRTSTMVAPLARGGSHGTKAASSLAIVTRPKKVRRSARDAVGGSDSAR